ncbi:Aldehyde Dehydrogenase [Chlorobaculum parvum NCIB 8327]|uniref:Aldehyde dehydrogenase n=1 Tax=Chlorobaculum parvum (strain DSM 263 / NCIMB 8327) TaxID=517417 RepID=B3QKW4_CHLP8|nr:aldehyde dehydrogenase family protein [Chlorobaculum parvum]ACF10752.1 Aldehyde Dehydrogenase [Chlorobaculum parvum NCIB 8327]
MPDFYDATTHAGLQRYFDSGATRSFEWRREQLRGLDAFLHEREAAIAEAVHADLGKPVAETWLTETGYLCTEIRYALRNLRRWMRPKRVGVPLHYQFARAFVEREPVGVALIIGAWNYPLQLCLAPLIGALAGGNCALLKPSELAPATSALLASELGRYVDPQAIRIVEGDGELSARLLEHRFDHIFFTGSRRTGQAVMQAAARHLTPVTLELGGKCPVIVTEQADLRVAARRIVWAKFLNAGQTCVSPDYLLVHHAVEERLLALMKEALATFYGPDPKLSPHYGRIVDERNFHRVKALQHEGSLVTGGGAELSSCCIEPTIVRNVPADSDLMSEEVFGPVLPVRAFSSFDEVAGLVASMPDPLALYLFSRDRSERRELMRRIRSGTVCCNDLLFQASIPGLPFGGRGMSGMGRYHGKAGFDTFTSERSVLCRSGFPDPDLRYPPYTACRFGLLKRIVTFFS